MKDPNRLWWLSLVVFAGCCVGIWAFERAVFPSSSGIIGAVIGFLLGAFMAALLEDYIEQSAE